MLELTSTQRDIYLEGKFFGAVVNNIGGYQRYFCEIDVPRFVRARELLLRANDAYDLRFDAAAGSCVPIVKRDAHPELRILDFSARSSALAWMQTQFEAPFVDISDAVFQDALLKVAGEEYWYFAKAHHLIVDGMGFALQMQRFLELYERLGQRDAMDELENVSYPSFVEYMRRQAVYPLSAQYEESKRYWLAQYDTLPHALLPPRDAGALIAGSATSRRASRVIDAALFRSLQEIAKAAGANIVAVFYAVLYVYFSRAYASRDLVISSPVHNRRSALEKDIIGSLVNVNCHRLTSRADIRFVDLVRSIAQQQKRDHRHSRFPIGDLARALRDRLAPSRRGPHELAFNYQKLDFQLTVGGKPIETHYLSHNRESTPLTFVLCEYGPDQDVVLHLDHAIDCFDEDTAAETLSRIHGLLQQVRRNSDLEIDCYNLLTPDEWRRQFEGWNDTRGASRHDVCIHEFFEEQAQRTPDDAAVACDQDALTYRELNERANRLAHRLIELGAGPDRFVGVCHRRTTDMMVAILAVLKSGAAYVPLDPAYPSSRLQYILDDTQVSVVLTDALGADALSHGNRCVIEVGAHLASPDAAAYPSSNPARSELTAQNLAYVIYTSGSTGKPKGVLIEHRNTAALIQWALRIYSREELSGVLAATSICFDLSVFEMFVPLAMGGKVVLEENVLALRSKSVDGISLINTVPSAIRSLLEAKAIPASVLCINLAGELLRQDLVDALYERHNAKVYDLYGPSEDTTYSTFCLRARGGSESIGRPIADTQVYVFDAAGDPLPTGLTGELHIGGAGLARGYLNQATLTDEKFVFNKHANSRVYRTGDLVRFGRDGNLRYVGRKDDQVKIRGYRIELGEIEACLSQHPAVMDCAVIARDDVVGEASKVLVAYLVAASVGTEESKRGLTSEVTSHLTATLPAYMIPSMFVYLPELPLTPNGKIDRKTLPAPGEISKRVNEYLAPRSDTEQRLCAQWEGILKSSRIGVHDNFFALGGDSLVLMRLAGAIEAEFGNRIDLSSLFVNATIESQAKLLDQQRSWTTMLDAVSLAEDSCDTSHMVL